MKKIPKIGNFAKAFVISLGLTPIAASAWFAIGLHSDDANSRYLSWILVISTIFISIYLPFYLIKIISVQFTSDGVEQLIFSLGQKWWAKRNFKWQEIERFSLEKFSYKLIVGDKEIFIHLACFNDFKEVVNFINSKIPKNAIRIN